MWADYFRTEGEREMRRNGGKPKLRFSRFSFHKRCSAVAAIVSQDEGATRAADRHRACSVLVIFNGSLCAPDLRMVPCPL
jgi:hypothetical protein